jgi:AcrR family transcriptional regulator
METRERILREARELFLAQGLNGFSMRGLAQRVGLSATALYRHFADKDALLAELVDESFSTFAKFLKRALAGRTPLERMRRTGESYFDFALEHPQQYKLMFLVDCQELGFDRISEEIQLRARGTFEFLMERISDCIDNGDYTPGNPQQLALSVWSQTHGLAALWLQGHLGELDEPQLRSQISLTLDHMEAALKARASAAP